MRTRQLTVEYGNAPMPRLGAPISVDVGLYFGRLYVCKEDEPYLWRGRLSRRRWICTCECGTTTSVREDMLKSGRTVSCGCFRVEKTVERFTLHGAKRSNLRLPEYQAWQSLLHRNNAELICPNWRLPEGEGFSNFLRDLGRRPMPRHRVVRVNADDQYCGANCLWSDTAARCGVPRRKIQIDNVDMTLREAAVKFGVPYALLCRRLQRGWSAERAIGPLE